MPSLGLLLALRARKSGLAGGAGSPSAIPALSLRMRSDSAVSRLICLLADEPKSRDKPDQAGS